MPDVMKIQIDEETHPKAYHPNVGDVVQCYINFAITPDTIIQDVGASVNEPHLVKIGTAFTSDPAMAGGGQISVFFYVLDEGLCQLRLVPIGSETKEYVIAILAEKPKV